MLSKKAYYEANKGFLGVRLRRFQGWFHSVADDKKLIEANAKPKLEKVRQHSKVEFQASRTNYSPQNKLDLINQYDRRKVQNPSLTLKKFCSTRSSLKTGTFGKWLPAMERKRLC